MSDILEDIGFALNFTNIVEIDIMPNSTTPTYRWLAAGISNISPEGNEATDDTPYYDGEGGNSSDVTGGQVTLAVEGHRRYGDPAQDFIVSRALSYGEGRKTNVRWTTPEGDVFEGSATLADLVPGSGMGAANEKGAFACTIRFNGTPKYSPAAKVNLPQTVTAIPMTINSVGSTATITPSVSPTTASSKCLFAVEDSSIATVDMDGLVTGVAVGTTKITIKCAAKPTVLTQVDVTVGSGTSTQSASTSK